MSQNPQSALDQLTEAQRLIASAVDKLKTPVAASAPSQRGPSPVSSATPVPSPRPVVTATPTNPPTASVAPRPAAATHSTTNSAPTSRPTPPPAPTPRPVNPAPAIVPNTPQPVVKPPTASAAPQSDPRPSVAPTPGSIPSVPVSTPSIPPPAAPTLNATTPLQSASAPPAEGAALPTERVSEVGQVGVFNGEFVIMPSGKRYQVPPNYISKSKLIMGDKLKLMKEGDYNEYKVMEEVPRVELTGGILTKKENQWIVLINNHEFRLIAAAIRFYNGEMGDRVDVLVPADYQQNPPVWAAVKELTKSPENAARQALLDERSGGVEPVSPYYKPPVNPSASSASAPPGLSPVPPLPTTKPVPVAPSTPLPSVAVDIPPAAAVPATPTVGSAPAPASMNQPTTPKTSSEPTNQVEITNLVENEVAEGESVVFDDIPDLR